MEAASIAINAIDKVLRLLTNEADSFQEVIARTGFLPHELANLLDLIENVKLLERGAEAWLMEAARISQRVEFVLCTYLLQVTQRRHQRGFKNLIRQTKPGLGIVASEIPDVVIRLREMKIKGKERGLFFENPGHGNSCCFEEDGIVGLESEKEELVGNHPSAW